MRDVIVSKEQSKWEIVYWSTDQGKSTIEEWFDSLTKEQFKSIAKEMKLLELSGNLLKLPHSRSLKKGLFELRERSMGLEFIMHFYAIR